MHYFITGTAGFIGFHLARRLLQDGHRVIGFDGLTPYYNVKLKHMRHAALAQFPAFKPVVAMLEDQKALEDAVGQAKPDILIHLAAQAGVRYSLENPRAYLSSNVEGSWNILETAERHNVQHLMLASTSSIYGANPSVPFHETDRADEPLTVYAATKKSMELMAHSHAHLYKLPTTAFRFFTVYGPWGRPDMALFKFVKSMLENQPIEIYGEGKMSRDFTYIDDLVEFDRAAFRDYAFGRKPHRRRQGRDAVPPSAVSCRQYRRRSAGQPDGLRGDSGKSARPAG